MNERVNTRRLWGAVEDFLDGESQGNVSGLRQALAVCVAEDQDVFKLAEIAIEALGRIVTGGGYYGDLARQYKEYASKALNDMAHEARKQGHHDIAALAYRKLNERL